MGAIGGFLGLSGGASGSGFAAPAAATINAPTTPDQISSAYSGNQSALQSQQALLQALQKQNGLGNQSQVYGQLQGVVNGTGPNPAQAMLAQSTGQNTANQAALMAGQRGAGSNVGLIARQAAQQGGANQENAAGQAATLQANQSLNALTSAGNIANTQAANQIGATTANTQAQQQEQQNLLNALGGYNNALTSSQNSVNAGNAALAGTAMGAQQGTIGGLLNAAGQAIGGARGGQVKNYDAGGPVVMASDLDDSGDQTSTSTDPNYNGAGAAAPMPGSLAANPLSGGNAPVVQPTAQPVQSKFGQFLKTLGNKPGGQSGQGSGASASAAPNPLFQGFSSLGSGIASAFSGDEDEGARGGSVGGRLKSGGGVPGQPRVPGRVNSYQNDTVKALLSPGEIVIPRSVSMSDDPVRGAARFVAEVIAKRKARA